MHFIVIWKFSLVSISEKRGKCNFLLQLLCRWLSKWKICMGNKGCWRFYLAWYYRQRTSQTCVGQYLHLLCEKCLTESVAGAGLPPGQPAGPGPGQGLGALQDCRVPEPSPGHRRRRLPHRRCQAHVAWGCQGRFRQAERSQHSMVSCRNQTFHLPRGNLYSFTFYFTNLLLAGPVQTQSHVSMLCMGWAQADLQKSSSVLSSAIIYKYLICP